MRIRNDTLSGTIQSLHNAYNLDFFNFNKLSDILKMIDKLDKQNFNLIAVDIETSGFDFVTCDMLGVGIAWDLKTGCYFNTRNLSDSDIKIVIEKINTLKAKKCYWNGYFD